SCNCNPAGVLPTFLGCGSSVTSGKLCECKERVSEESATSANRCIGISKSAIPWDVRTATVTWECVEGTYQLDENDLFGCKDCGCDIGGSVNNICDKQTVRDRRWKELRLELQVRYGYDENVFPGFSWRGYAVFSELQKEVLLDLFIEKPSLYQVFLYYMNFGGENVYGIITFTPETFGDIQQSYDMLFEVTTRPKFMKVSGKQGLIASPFVLNPGRWTVSIRVERPLFLDYMVLLPQSYYEATLLQQEVSNPCILHDKDSEVCLLYRYPPFSLDAEIVRGEIGYVLDDDQRKNTVLFDEPEALTELQTSRMALLGKEQNNLNLDYTISQPGPYVMMITYHTPQKGQSATATIDVESSPDRIEQGRATFYDCGYSFLCRLAVVDQQGEVATFNLESNYVNVAINMVDDYSDVAIDEVAFVPANLWHMDYIVPKTLCIRKDGQCIESEYLPVPESTKIEFESGYNEYQKASVLPNGVTDTDIVLVNLKELDNVIDLQGTVSTPGLYAFIVHYYQPDHPTFEAKVIIQDGEYHEATLPLPFCPSVSGCRTVVHAKDTQETAFQIEQNFQLNIRQPANKTVWLGYVLAIPSKEFHEKVLTPLPLDKAGKFLKECGKNSFLLDPEVAGFCREAAFALTSEYNNGALPCQCDTDGSLSFECEEFGGACECKPHVIGRTCSQCRTGYFGFPNCKPCDCPSTAFCQPVTGQCICPPRVTGERCDVCVDYTYGFDPIIGCEECNCYPLGVVNGNLQCDLETGQCQCKSNVVGRNCNKCKAGYWAFPHCQLCNCDLRGSTESICDEDSARCYCKECAPGYYRSKTGPYLGYCVPCQCNGHAQTCDINTGKCIGCQHNTVGDHCEKCEAGYHGDSTQGTPYDCLICACPLPIASNNFAESCEVSPSGQEISCVCKPGYYGGRCEVFVFIPY
ncbi:laminin subunit alpha, partial [Trichonephila clavata]